MYSAKSIANYFIQKALQGSGRNDLSPMKLQKLVYMAHGWHLAITGKPLLDEQVSAWQYGPVIPSLYHEFKHYGNEPITCFATELADEQGFYFEPVPIPVNEMTVNILDKVCGVYGSLSAIQLSNMAHQPDTPWGQVWRESQGIKEMNIPQEIIRQYFSDLAMGQKDAH